MDELFLKLINDRLMPDELTELRERFNASSDDELASLINSHTTDDPDSTGISPAIIDNIKSNIDRQLFPETATGHHRPMWMKRAIRVAAVLVTLILTGGIWLSVNSGHTTAGGMCTILTAGNETSSLTLPDGTSVKINGNSEFTFPADFGKEMREITFSGEAYFEVAKNPDVPMIISTPSMTITVKGTAFNLMSRPGAKYSELSLDNGLVTVTRQHSVTTVDMTPGNRLILDNATGSISLSDIDTPHHSSSWTSMEIYFDNASPSYLIDRIEQTYGVTLDKSITECIDENFTGTLPADNLDEAIRIIKRLYR